MNMEISNTGIILEDIEARYEIDLEHSNLRVTITPGVMEDSLTYSLRLFDSPEFSALKGTLDRIIKIKTDDILIRINDLIKNRFRLNEENVSGETNDPI